MSLFPPFCFLLVFSIARGQGIDLLSPCDRGKWNHAKSVFNTLSYDIIQIDHNIQQFCKHFKEFSARETFSRNVYKVEIVCAGFEHASWDVKIKYRVIYIIGHHPKKGRNCDLTFVHIKVIPLFVNTHAAVWSFKDGLFVVAMPFKYSMDWHPISCNQDIEETLIPVRRGFPNERIFEDSDNS